MNFLPQQIIAVCMYLALFCHVFGADGGSVLKTYTRQGVRDIASGTNQYYTADHLGSVREVWDEGGGGLLARYDYKPYGERILVSGTDVSTKGFTGHDSHAASGLVLTRYRAYDPMAGRWLSPDPLGEAGGMNLYGYVGNDPVNATDPLGLYSWEGTNLWESATTPLLDAGSIVTGMIDGALAAFAGHATIFL